MYKLKTCIVAFWINLYSRGLFFVLLLFFCFSASFADAQWGDRLNAQWHAGQSTQRTTIAFWNTENLYDTIPSPFYDDSDYTPSGSFGWNTERYRTKITNLARVIDQIGADIVGLAEVENEGVVRDLVSALKTDYNYIHRTSGDSRGIDVALLYKGDKFFPDTDPRDPSQPAARLIRSGTGREFLLVSGEFSGEPGGKLAQWVGGKSESKLGVGSKPEGKPGSKPSDKSGSDRVDIIVCHLASNLNGTEYRRRNMQSLRTVLERIRTEDPAKNIIVMGDMNAPPGERLVRKTLGSVRSPFDFMYSPHWEAYRAGKGSYNYRDRWYLYDWMMLSPTLAHKVVSAGIYAKEYMTEPYSTAAGVTPAGGTSRPLRTFRAGDWSAGYSDHFPVYVVLEK